MILNERISSSSRVAVYPVEWSHEIESAKWFSLSRLYLISKVNSTR